MEKIIKYKIGVLLLVFSLSTYADNDDACKLYLCLMGDSVTAGGSDCVTAINQYISKFSYSCPDLPTCTGHDGSIIMNSVAGNGGSYADGNEIKQSCLTVFSFWSPPWCKITFFESPATKKISGNWVSGVCGVSP